MTVEIPEGIGDRISPEFASVIGHYFGKTDGEPLATVAEATEDYLYWELPSAEGSTEKLFFLTDPKLFRNLNVDEMRNIAPLKNSLASLSGDESLTLPRTDAIDASRRAEIAERLRRNELLRDAITSELAEFHDYANSTNLSRWGFSAIDALSSVTHVRQSDPAPITELLDSGNKLMRMIQESYRRIANSRREYYAMNLEIIEPRIRAYRNMLRDFDSGKLRTSLPERYAESFAGYYASAGMPAETRGTFHSASGDIGASLAQVSFNYPMLLLTLGGDEPVHYLVTLKNSARAIAGRKYPVSTRDPLRFDAEVRLLTQMSGIDSGTAPDFPSGEKVRAIWDGISFSLQIRLPAGDSRTVYSGRAQK